MSTDASSLPTISEGVKTDLEMSMDGSSPSRTGNGPGAGRVLTAVARATCRARDGASRIAARATMATAPNGKDAAARLVVSAMITVTGPTSVRRTAGRRAGEENLTAGKMKDGTHPA